MPGENYEHLMSPLDVGAFVLPNRVVMGSMHMRLEYMDHGNERLAAFYARRAAGKAALVVTGGVGPNKEGAFDQDSPLLQTEADIPYWKVIPEQVHAAGGKVVMQILHTGRYAKHELNVGASGIQSPITRYKPRILGTDEVWQTVEDFVNTARLAQMAGFDGVEIMGSEGYLITQFLASRTNDRDDEWGGSLENRMKFAIEITRRTREAVGDDFLIMFRTSVIDLVDGGMTGAEIQTLGKALEVAGANVLNSGIGWHEARVPTIANMVPRGAWGFATKSLKEAVNIPVMASNRINTPALAEKMIAAGDADLISLARPMLADPDFALKVGDKRANEVNVCIGCNQACLDLIFTEQPATCLVNPFAGREYEKAYKMAPVATGKSVAVVGAGPAGMAFAVNAAERGHKVTLFDAAAEIGGQLNMAKVVPGKADFYDLIGYYDSQIKRNGVELKLNTRADADMLAGFDEVVVATGVSPRTPDIPGIDHAKVVSYLDVLTGAVEVGKSAAIIGAGGIGFDVAEFLSTDEPSEDEAIDHFMQEWGVDTAMETAGSLKPTGFQMAPSKRELYLLQRKPGKPGRGLGLTTGWVLKMVLDMRGVSSMGGVEYLKVDDQGLHIRIDGKDEKVLDVEHVIVCAGQEPERSLYEQLTARGVKAHLIGGAELASELDAMRAIDEGTRLALAS